MRGRRWWASRAGKPLRTLRPRPSRILRRQLLSHLDGVGSLPLQGISHTRAKHAVGQNSAVHRGCNLHVNRCPRTLQAQRNCCPSHVKEQPSLVSTLEILFGGPCGGTLFGCHSKRGFSLGTHTAVSINRSTPKYCNPYYGGSCKKGTPNF